MKKKNLIIMIVSVLVIVAAIVGIAISNNKQGPEPTIIPTVAPTETIVPTVEPTLEPTPTDIPTPEPTVEPTIAPTDVPHEHVWEKKELPATCAEDGKVWEECECGATQNEVKTEDALGHRKCTYKVTKEPTLTEEGTFETVCDICGTIVSSGTLPVATPTPLPTSTPTPKPTSTPTPKPKCSHRSTETVMIEETDTEKVYQDKCEVCGEIVETRRVPKATATPKPTPTPKPVVIITPTPKPDWGEPVKTETETYDNPYQHGGYAKTERTYYENIIVDRNYYPEDVTNCIFSYTYRDTVNGTPLYDEELLAGDFIGCTGFSVKYYIFRHRDCFNSASYVMLVNSDGSPNKYSVNKFYGTRFRPEGQKGWAGPWDASWQTLLYMRFLGEDDQEFYIYQEDFIYYDEKGGIVRLFDY